MTLCPTVYIVVLLQVFVNNVFVLYNTVLYIDKHLVRNCYWMILLCTNQDTLHILWTAVRIISMFYIPVINEKKAHLIAVKARCVLSHISHIIV